MGKQPFERAFGWNGPADGRTWRQSVVVRHLNEVNTRGKANLHAYVRE